MKILFLCGKQKNGIRKVGKAVQKAGAQYVVLTTKHHDDFVFIPVSTGFQLCRNGTERDITGELTDAVRAEGIRMGLYYSGLIDWQYANDPIFEDDDPFWNCQSYILNMLIIPINK